MCIKWPNDIYYQNRVKLGGVLVSAFSPSSPTSPTTAVIGEGKTTTHLFSTYNSCLFFVYRSSIAKYVRALLQNYELLSTKCHVYKHRWKMWCTEAFGFCCLFSSPPNLGFLVWFSIARCMRVERSAIL